MKNMEQSSFQEKSSYHTKQSEPVSKTIEKLSIVSGHLLVIDQFMLGNNQFLSRFQSTTTISDEARIAKEYGGSVVEIPEGDYLVYRDPIDLVIAVIPAKMFPEETSSQHQKIDHFIKTELKNQPKNPRKIYIDTRCLVFIDSKLLFDKPLMREFSQLRHSNMDKQARDLVRSSGGAVRYGFNKLGDELALCINQEQSVILLWPDVL